MDGDLVLIGTPWLAPNKSWLTRLAADGFDRSLSIVGDALAVELVLVLGLFALGWIACLLHRVPEEDLPLGET